MGFRFTRTEVERIAVGLGFPDITHYENYIPVPATIGLATYLACYVTGDQLPDMDLKFGWNPSHVSLICKRIEAIIDQQYEKILY